MEKVRIGVIGVGNMGPGHVRAIKNIPEIKAANTWVNRCLYDASSPKNNASYGRTP